LTAMNEHKTVSIIIPFYNAERHIPSCIASLEKQSYADFEAVFVSDGSTDGAEALLRACKDERIKVYRTENRGVSAARNFGLRQASGEYIAFMDVDDELEPDYLSAFVSAMKRSGVDAAICDYTEVYSDGRTKKVLLPWQNTALDRDTIRDELLPEMIAGTKGEAVRGLVWRTFTKREFIEKEKLTFIEGIPVAEDLLFTLQLYNRACSIYVLSECLYNYRVNPKSTLHRYRKNEMQNHMRFHAAYVDVLQKEGLYESNKKRYERNRIRLYSYAVSNAVRNPEKSEASAEIAQIREYFLSEKIDYRECELPKSVKLAYWLLKKNMITPLVFLYSAKEKIRQVKGL